MPARASVLLVGLGLGVVWDYLFDGNALGVSAPLAAPLLVLFTLLLAAADAVWADYVGRALRLTFLAELPRLFGHGVVAVAVGWVAAGGLLYAIERRSTGREPDDAARVALLGFVE